MKTQNELDQARLLKAILDQYGLDANAQNQATVIRDYFTKAGGLL